MWGWIILDHSCHRGGGNAADSGLRQLVARLDGVGAQLAMVWFCRTGLVVSICFNSILAFSRNEGYQNLQQA